MIQMPYRLSSESDLEASVTEVTARLTGLPRVNRLLIFINLRRLTADGRQAVQRIKGAFPQAEIMGTVTSFDIVNGSDDEKYMSVCYIAFESSDVDIAVYDFEKCSSQAAGQEFLQRLAAHSDTAIVGLVSAGPISDQAAFLDTISEARSVITFFGGMTDDGSIGDGLIFTGHQELRRGVAAIIFYGADLYADYRSSLGWKPLGRNMTITEMDGAYRIISIDGQRPIDIYRKYLGIENDDEFILESLTFPLFLERDGMTIARHPQACLPDGSMIFGADLHVGEQVRLSYGDPYEILERAADIQREMHRFQPQCILAVSCMARHMLLGFDTDKELQLSRRDAPVFGFYAYGEIMRHSGKIMVSNMTLEIVGLREGGQTAVPAAIAPAHIAVDRRTSIIMHMVKFIETTMHELEVSNAKLRELAQTDHLTALMNRGETDDQIARALNGVRVGNPMALLLLDIDDFKGVNDNYGHFMGDAALRAVAALLQGICRRDDFPGRWGGDEFIVGLINVNKEQAIQIAERIRKHVKKYCVLPDGGHLTTSIGIVMASPDDTVESLFLKADKALYEAKQSGGKNSVKADWSIEKDSGPR